MGRRPLPHLPDGSEPAIRFWGNDFDDDLIGCLAAAGDRHGQHGERVIAAIMDDPGDDRKAWYPADAVPSDRTYVVPSPTSVVREGRINPDATELLAEFMIGDDVKNMYPADDHSRHGPIPSPPGNPAIRRCLEYDCMREEPAARKK